MSERPESAAARPERMLTFAGGGYVLVIMAIILTSLMVWALWGPVSRSFDRPPGDGEDPTTYGFELGNLAVDPSGFGTPMLHRDIVPVVDQAAVIDVAEVQERSKGRGKYLVPNDRVVGVIVGDETRAYPISILTVHEVIHDTLGDTPIAVTYSWLGDAPAVWDRRTPDAGEPVMLGSSGLLWSCTPLYYDTSTESLWLQLTGEAISGPRAGETLRPIEHELTSWASWLERHPQTTVADMDASMAKRYKKSGPDTYFNSDEIPYPVVATPETNAKSRVIVVDVGAERRVYTHGLVRERAGEGSWTDELGDATVTFTPDRELDSVTIDVSVDGAADTWSVRHALWFAWYAAHPSDSLAR